MQRKSALAAAVATLFGVGAVGGLALAHDDSTKLRADLSGANEVPAADPDGDGRSKVEVFAEDGRVCFSVKFDDTGTPNRGHIHAGIAGQNGGIVVPLFELAPPQNTNPADPRNDELESRRRLEGCVENVAPALLADIEANPSNYYVNLHNARFPAGAIRGQLTDGRR